MRERDGQTSIEETLSALDSLAAAGKARYLAASDYAGWQLRPAPVSGPVSGPPSGAHPGHGVGWHLASTIVMSSSRFSPSALTSSSQVTSRSRR